MNKYLLLRDNKQSGPYSVAELVEKGIKAYDLVWLDGKSAAWRYPSEIEELKAYAPTVEEQPYDRFYKKPSQQLSYQQSQQTQQTQQTQQIRQAQLSQQTQQSQQARQPEHNLQDQYLEPVVARKEPEIPAITRQAFVPAPAEQAPREIPSIQTDQPRKIYVTLPGTTTKTAAKTNVVDARSQPPKSVEPVVKPPEKISDIPAELPVGVQPADPALEAYAPVPSDRAFVSQDRIAFPEDSDWPDSDAAPKKPTLSNRKRGPGNRSASPVAETFASFSDRLTAKLTQKTYSSRTIAATDAGDSRRSNNTPATNRNKTIMTAIVAVCLLLGGVIIGLVISNSKNESQAELDRLVQQIQSRQAGSNTASIVPAAGSALAQTPVTTAVEQPVAAEPEPVIEKPRQPKQNVAEPAVANSQQQSGISTPVVPALKNDKPAVIESAVAKQENNSGSAEAEETRKNIRQLVTLQNNKYKTGVLGGISDLELTISNKSEYELDAVEVEVAYLGPERRVIRTQTIVFNNVKPGKTSIQEVPKSSRGVTVNTSIKSIQSKSLGLTYSGL